jgi:uncharacterized membrane protein YphA (DoxX/SURF4 family)
MRIVVAAILVQTLYFKFTGAAESIYIFKTLGMEPYGRIGSGIIELVSSILILIPRTTLLGALLGLGVMIGAIVSHVLFWELKCKTMEGHFYAGINYLSLLFYFSVSK